MTREEIFFHRQQSVKVCLCRYIFMCVNKFTTLPFLTAAASHLYWSQTLEGSCPCTLWECPPWLRDSYAPHEANLVENSSTRLFDTKFQQIKVNLQFVSLNKTASIRVILIPQLKQDLFYFNVKLIQLLRELVWVIWHILRSSVDLEHGKGKWVGSWQYVKDWLGTSRRVWVIGLKCAVCYVATWSIGTRDKPFIPTHVQFCVMVKTDHMVYLLTHLWDELNWLGLDTDMRDELDLDNFKNWSF